MADTRTLKTAARYLGLKGNAMADPAMAALLETAYGEMRAVASPRHTLVRSAVQVEKAPEEPGQKPSGTLFFGDLPPIQSRDLCRLFDRCHGGYALLATLGLPLDLLIRKLAIMNPALSAAVGACGSAYIDTYIDGVLRAEGERLRPGGEYLTPRFSPGYGDVGLPVQPALLRLLGAGKLGVHLTEALLMVPEKSVSALVGITSLPRRSCPAQCAACDKTDCPFREEEA